MRFSRMFVYATLALTCLLVLCPLAQAQYRTSIQGVVTDATGAVIPGATLTLTNPATNEKQVRTSNEAGVYNFNALPSAATFNLEVTAKGFQKKVIDHLDLVPEQSNGLDVRLAVGAESQTVTVDASIEPLLTTANANIVGVISENQVQSMPSFGRDVFKLIQLTPGLFSDGSQTAGGAFNLPGTQTGGGATGGNAGIFQTENGPQGQSAGQQFENNGISIDGVSTTSAVWGGNTIITPTEDSVASVTTVVNAYDAEYGRFSGAHVEVTSKSGTNKVHGSLFFTRHSAGLNAYQSDNTPGNTKQRDNNQFNQLGGSVGGPIWKNKIFGFFAIETIQQGYSPVTGLQWYDTPDFDSLASSVSIASKYLTFPGNAPKSTGINVNGSTCALAGLTEGTNCVTIPGKGINIGTPLTTGLGMQDLTRVAGTTPGWGSGLGTVADVAQYNTVNPTTSSKYQYNGRLDANLSSKDAIGFMIYWVPVTTTNYNGNRTYDIFHHSQINEAYTAVWNHTFSPTLLNELRGNVAGWHYNEITSNPQSPVGLPQAGIDSIFSLGIQSFGPNIGGDDKQWTYGLRDLVTKVQGRHTLKFGVDYTKVYYLSACYPCGEPSYSFYNIWDFLNDAPKSEGGTFNPATGVPSVVRQDDLANIMGIFAQDDWRLKKNLTINLGLRWNYLGPAYEKHNQSFVAVPGAGADFLSGMVIRKGGSAWNAQKGNFGPQIGFSWSPMMFHDKMVVRGGYGLSYNQDEFAITQNTLSNTGFSIGAYLGSPDQTHINPNIYYAVSSDPHSLTGYPANKNVITTYGANGLPTPTSGVQANVFLTQPNPPTMMTQHYSLDTQYDLGHQVVASLGYMGSVTRNSYFHMNPVGYAASMGWAQNPAIGGCCDFWTHKGSGNYNAMLAEVKHQFSHGFMADVQYTWSKSMDTSSAPYSEQYYPNHPSWSYGRSDYNVASAFKVFGMWQPVLFKGNNAKLEKIAGGWSISGIWNAHTGFPWNPVYNLPSSMYASNGGYYQALPSAYLGGAGHDTSNHAYEYGTNFPNGGKAYFAAPVISSDGFTPALPGVKRNSLTMAGYKDVDMTLAKSFGLPNAPVLGEAAKLEFRLDIYNLFNNVNLNPGTIQTDVNSGRFGQETSALGARVMTLGARFSF